MMLRVRLLTASLALHAIVSAWGGQGVPSPNGRELALERRDGQVTIVNLARGGVRLTARPRPDAEAGEPDLDAFAWSPDGTRLAVLYGDGVVRLLGARTGSVEGELATTPDDPERRSWVRRTVRWVDDERVVVSHGNAPTELWHVAGSEPLATLDAPGGQVTAVALSDDRARLALGNLEGQVAVWAMPDAELVGRLPDQGARINVLDFDPQGTRLALGARDCVASTWSLTDWSRLGSYSHCDLDLFDVGYVIGCVQFSPDGRHLVTTSGDLWAARVWSLDDGRLTCAYQYGGGSAAWLSANFVAGGRQVVLGIDGAVLDTESGALVTTLAPVEERRRFVRCVDDVVWLELDDRLRVWTVAGDGWSGREIPLPE